MTNFRASNTYCHFRNDFKYLKKNIIYLNFLGSEKTKKVKF